MDFVDIESASVLFQEFASLAISRPASEHPLLLETAISILLKGIPERDKVALLKDPPPLDAALRDLASHDLHVSAKSCILSASRIRTSRFHRSLLCVFERRWGLFDLNPDFFIVALTKIPRDVGRLILAPMFDAIIRFHRVHLLRCNKKYSNPFYEGFLHCNDWHRLLLLIESSMKAGHEDSRYNCLVWQFSRIKSLVSSAVIANDLSSKQIAHNCYIQAGA